MSLFPFMKKYKVKAQNAADVVENNTLQHIVH